MCGSSTSQAILTGWFRLMTKPEAAEIDRRRAMAETHNHHFVPQGYLRGFADGVRRKATFRVVDLGERKVFRTLVRNVAAKRDFNRIDVEDQHPNALEEAYGHFESEAATSIRRVVEAGEFTGEDRIVVLNLVALLIIRNPRMRENWADFMDRLWRMTGKTMVSKKSIWESTVARMKADGHEIKEGVSYEQMRDFIQSDEYDIVTDRHMHIRLEIEHLDTILPLLVRRKWRLGIVPEDQPELITSDHPVSLISTIRRPGGLAGALGYGLKNTAVVFPLDRRHSLWGTFEGEDEVVQNTRDQTAILNTHTMHNADRQIYSFDDKFQYFFNGTFRPGPELLPDIARYQAERHGY